MKQSERSSIFGKAIANLCKLQFFAFSNVLLIAQ